MAISLTKTNILFAFIMLAAVLGLGVFFLEPASAVGDPPTLRHSARNNGNPSVTVSGVTPAGTNRFGIVKVAFFQNASVSTVTWGGVDISSNVIKNAVHDFSNRKRMAWFYYLNPPASSADVVVTASASGPVEVIVEAWDNVDQTTPYGDLTVTADETEENANPAIKTITADSGKVVNDGFFMWTSGGAGTTWSLSGDQTQIQGTFADLGGGANTAVFGSSYATSDGSVDMTWDTDNPATNRWAMYIISLNTASPSTDETIPDVLIKGGIQVKGGVRLK